MFFYSPDCLPAGAPIELPTIDSSRTHPPTHPPAPHPRAPTLPPARCTDAALRYVRDNGAVTAAAYPFVARDQTCRVNGGNYSRGFNLVKMQVIPDYWLRKVRCGLGAVARVDCAWGALVPPPSCPASSTAPLAPLTLVQQLLLGPVIIGVDSSSNWQTYRSGVFSNCGTRVRGGAGGSTCRCWLESVLRCALACMARILFRFVSLLAADKSLCLAGGLLRHGLLDSQEQLVRVFEAWAWGRGARHLQWRWRMDLS